MWNMIKVNNKDIELTSTFWSNRKVQTHWVLSRAQGPNLVMRLSVIIESKIDEMQWLKSGEGD